MSLACGRKPECPDRTHADNMPTPHRPLGGIECRTLLQRDDSANRHTAVPPQTSDSSAAICRGGTSRSAVKVKSILSAVVLRMQRLFGCGWRLLPDAVQWGLLHVPGVNNCWAVPAKQPASKKCTPASNGQANNEPSTNNAINCCVWKCSSTKALGTC